MTAFVDLSQVAFSYADRLVVRNISITCSKGERIAILGRSGVGKSTLLRLIAGLEIPAAGNLRVDGLSPLQFRSRGSLAMAFQEPALLPYLSVAANIRLSRKFRPPIGEARPAQDDPAAIAAAMRIEELLALYPHQLSGGMKTRAALAQALFSKPELLLLDEPFSRLDDALKFDIYDDFNRIQAAAKTTTILVTHDIGEAVLLSDTVIMLARGPSGAAIALTMPIPFGQDRPQTLITQPDFVAIVQKLRNKHRELSRGQI